MCGICGAVERRTRVDPETLRRMATRLRHRGPDDDGFFVSAGHRNPSAGLGFRRLAIIDLETGSQPMTNEDETVRLVLNGEIYNYRELRRELKARGHDLRTVSDTEVIVHLYEELGPACVERLHGMFAFAIWDEKREQLVLARDRFGKKPLYYFETSDGGLVFAS